MRLLNHKITLRYSIGFSLLLTVLILIIITSLNNINQAQRKLDQLVGDINVKVAAVETMASMIRNIAIYTRDIILTTNPNEMQDALKNLRGARNIYDEEEARLDNVFVTKEDRELLTKVRQLRAIARPLVDRAIEFGLANKDKEASDLLKMEVVPTTSERLNALEHIIKNQKEVGRKAAEEAALAHAHARILTYGLGIFALALGIFVAFLFMPIVISMDKGISPEQVVGG